MSGEVSGEALLQRQVLLRGLRIGRSIDVVLDLDGLRAVGLELRCGDEVDRFLPWPVARLEEDAILLDSPLQLVEEEELSFYRRRGASLRSLRGLPVDGAEGTLGRLADVVVRPDGMLVALLLDGDDGRRRVGLDADLSVGGRRLRPAA